MFEFTPRIPKLREMPERSGIHRRALELLPAHLWFTLHALAELPLARVLDPGKDAPRGSVSVLKYVRQPVRAGPALDREALLHGGGNPARRGEISSLECRARASLIQPPRRVLGRRIPAGRFDVVSLQVPPGTRVERERRRETHSSRGRRPVSFTPGGHRPAASYRPRPPKVAIASNTHIG